MQNLDLKELLMKGGICLQSRHSSTNITDIDASDDRPKPEEGINEVLLMGRLGKDPEQFQHSKTSSSCSTFTTFSLATSRTYSLMDPSTESTTLRTRTDWHKIMVSKPTLQQFTMNTLSKGDKILLRGSIFYRKIPVNENLMSERAQIKADSITLILKKRKPKEQVDIDHFI